MYLCNWKNNNAMATITLNYDGRNKMARAIVDFIEKIGLFTLLKDDEPSETTVKAIEELKEGKAYKANDLQEMLDYLHS